MERRHDPNSIEGRIYSGLVHLIALRKRCAAFTGGAMDVIETGNGHVFGYARHHEQGRILVLANFSEHEQYVTADTLRQITGSNSAFMDLVRGEPITVQDDLILAPYRLYG